MPQPKKRTNKSKGGMRRMSQKAKSPSISYCDNCHEAVKSHQICKNCGFYKGKQLVDVSDKKEVIEEK